MKESLKTLVNMKRGPGRPRKSEAIIKDVRAEVLKRFTGNRKDNVFTLTEEPYNRDYFKTLWSRYKKQSSLLERDQTLYSFRHTGAIKVFEKTGSLLKLQQVMGHSDMKVSLTYLRGLEVKQLDLEDLPVLRLCSE
ncbi:hypothetical protein N9O65_02225 [Schleiferiaceae bacterium]|nr:hypothetical protein [Schleiferiaceae bacterium]